MTHPPTFPITTASGSGPEAGPSPAPLAAPEPAFDAFVLALTRATAPLLPRPDTVEALREAARLRLLPPRGHLQRKGEKARHFYVVARGLLCTYYEEPGTGLERTPAFFEEGEVVADAAGLVTGRPSGLAIQAVEEAAVVRLHWEAVRSLFETDHALERFGRLLAEEALGAALERASQAAAALTPTLPPAPVTKSKRRPAPVPVVVSPVEDRYRTFLEARPALAQRLPPALIASHLGITVEALARLRSRRFRGPGAKE